MSFYFCFQDKESGTSKVTSLFSICRNFIECAIQTEERERPKNRREFKALTVRPREVNAANLFFPDNT